VLALPRALRGDERVVDERWFADLTNKQLRRDAPRSFTPPEMLVRQGEEWSTRN
jgi:hypothetical protein